MTERYGYGYGEDDLPGSRRGPGVTGQRADEADPPERGADVREIDLTEDDPDERDEQVERLREAASEQDDDGQVQARSPFRLGPPVRADQDGDQDDEDDDEDEDRAGEEAPEAGAATVDISAPPGDGDEAAALAADEERVDTSARAAAEPVGEAGPGGVTLAPATPLPSSETGGEASATTAAAAAGAAPALRSGALLATDAEAIRRQFIEIQAGFVDEPRQAVERAGELVEELHRKVMASLQAERAQLDEAVDGQEPSTEELRQALRAYRAYVDRLLGLSL